MRNGEPALLESQLFCLYRNGYAEEIYLSFRCVPMADDSAIIRGVTVLVEETTDRVISARRAAALKEVSAAGAQADSVEDASSDALEALSHHSTDIPFALLYARNVNQRRARLIATAALGAGTPASPNVLALDSATGGASWPIGAVIETTRPAQSPPYQAPTRTAGKKSVLRMFGLPNERVSNNATATAATTTHIAGPRTPDGGWHCVSSTCALISRLEACHQTAPGKRRTQVRTGPT